jgi:hypothetical protein
MPVLIFFDATVHRAYEADVVPELFKGFGKGSGDIGESADFGEGRDFGRYDENFHE